MAFVPQPYTALAENTLRSHTVCIYRLDPLVVSARVPVARPAQRGIGGLNGTN
jgi:hypothetical protein